MCQDRYPVTNQHVGINVWGQSKIYPEELNMEMVKEMHAEAQKAEEEAAQKEVKELATNKSLIITKLPLGPEHGIDLDYWPDLVTVRECGEGRVNMNEIFLNITSLTNTDPSPVDLTRFLIWF